MTRRTRWFLVGSALIVVVGLCTGLVAYYNGGLQILSGPGPSELGYVPESAAIVAFANVGQIMKSDVRKRLQTAMPSGHGRDELQSEIGVDLERDIDTVVAGFGMHTDEAPAPAGTTTGAATSHAADRTIVLIRGRFDRPRIEGVLKEHGGTTEDYKGRQIFVEAVGSLTNSGHGAVSFFEPGLIALGSVEAVKAAIDAREDGQNIRKSAEVMKFVGEVDPTSNAWVTGQLASVTQNANLPPMARDRLAAVQWFSVSARIDGGITGVVRAEARDDQSGEDLRSVVRGGLAAARLMGGQNPKLDLAINSLQLSGAGKDVDLAFTVPPDLLDVAGGIAGLKNLAAGRH